MSSVRQLAAILFTDIVGYTALMQKDEEQALTALRRHNSALEKYARIHAGKIVNNYGDGSLLVFPSATAAVRCAIEIQKELQTEPRVPVRMGLHLGEIFYEKNKVIGDGVNLASRIQSLGIGNSILLSADIFNNIRNHPGFKVLSVGFFHFKNVDLPMEVFALALEGLAVPQRSEMVGKVAEPGKKPFWIVASFRYPVIAALVVLLVASLLYTTKFMAPEKIPNSIIVLPFSTGDSSQIYLADGMTTDVIVALAKIENISTLSWNSSALYAGTTKSLKEIADETGVSYILEGKIQKYRDNFRIHVELVIPESGKTKWAQSWDENLESVFEIQKQIARDVADKLGVELTREEHVRLARYPTQNFEAYDLFLKARAEARKFHGDPAFLERSNHLLEAALIIDPDFPEALTLRAYNRMDHTWAGNLDPAEQALKARSELERSLALDSTSSDTYLVLGSLNFFLEWNLQEAKKNFEKGWALSNYGDAPITQCFCGFIEFTMAKADYSGALSLLEKVEKLDPHYPYNANERLLIYGALGDTSAIRKMLNSDVPLDVYKAAIQYEAGNYQEAIKEFISMNSTFTWPTHYLASAYYKAGMIEKSDSLIEDMIRRSDHKRNIDFGLAIIYASRGDKENSLMWFKRAYKKRDFWILYTRVDTNLRLIIHEPEVIQILKEIGL